MSELISTLVDMGFSEAKAKLAIEKTGSTDIQEVMEWILSNKEEPDDHRETPEAGEVPDSISTQEIVKKEEEEEQVQAAKSIKCEECGKLFKTQEEVEFHAVKFGHGKFSESMDEKKPLSEEEKKEQLARIEAKLKQRRLEREAREKQEELEREKNRIRSGKEMLEAKKRHEEMEIKKIVEQRKKEKEEERLAKQRIREQIEQDKLARKAKFGGQVETPAVIPQTQPITQATPTQQNYTDVRLQIRLTNGGTLTQTFKATEPLQAVRLYIELNRTDTTGPFSLMTNYPRKIFEAEDYEKPLSLLGLAPSAVIIVSKVQ
ncbi:UBX domain-containing protein 1 [Onthophagus taurus]|uniref:UBX domain-containing protein 1 n=1 Tax=Onthophagus taurus TaxID=166361 RepID=UPI000C203AED|nr:UBX domain-containing protein 1 [Onthophagus taurus]